jgi:hypothetical protein
MKNNIFISDLKQKQNLSGAGWNIDVLHFIQRECVGRVDTLALSKEFARLVKAGKIPHDKLAQHYDEYIQVGAIAEFNAEYPGGLPRKKYYESALNLAAIEFAKIQKEFNNIAVLADEIRASDAYSFTTTIYANKNFQAAIDGLTERAAQFKRILNIARDNQAPIEVCARAADIQRCFDFFLNNETKNKHGHAHAIANIVSLNLNSSSTEVHSPSPQG